MPRKRRSVAAGLKLATDFKRSGLSRTEFCSKYKVTGGTLDRWLARAADAGGSAFLPVEIVGERHAPARQPVRSAGGIVRICLPTGGAIEAPVHCDHDWLSMLIRSLG